MTDVLVERKYGEPLTDEILRRNLEQALSCLDLHHVEWQHSFLSPDRRELICHFKARDAESVRLALQQAGAQRGLAWSGTVHDAPGATEPFDGGILVCRSASEPTRFETTGTTGSAEVLSLSTHRVSLLRCYVSKDRRRMLGVYRAADAEAVRLALRDDSATCESVWSCCHLRP